ncbi:protein-L-isoaspartate O-methyltransferase [Methylopila henanensis]|uniref:Protein-L-isoaspartate O-methyltransferase n=1 Tax=Methylopila henanensis TaxID=873516 RepID=A0ABW4K4F2_9HYPH
MTDFARLRTGMVDCQIRVADVTDHRVLGAFLTVERERFVPESRRGLAYLDTRTPLAPGRATMEPMTLAKLIQLADPQPNERALVVGAGLGYTAALLAHLVAEVVALESDPELAAGARAALSSLPNVAVVEGPLPDGAPSEGPFDLIFCDGAVSDGLDGLARQLAPGGRIVAPWGGVRPGKAAVFRLNGGELSAAPAFDAAAPALPGFERIEAFAL